MKGKNGDTEMWKWMKCKNERYVEWMIHKNGDLKMKEFERGGYLRRNTWEG